MMLAITPEFRMAFVFHHTRSWASGWVFRLGGCDLRAVIWLSLVRALSETTGRNLGSPLSSTAVT
ncbi:hypothetical protein [Streptomyces goshikiensis]|uniref:hypothetical protein n=1 Tax=Streptomyces goshikiensis TaxID=1942 RepID=UPI0033B27CAA